MLVWLLACVGTEKETGEDEFSTLEAVCVETVEVACEDAIIQDLALHDDKISDGDVNTSTDGPDFISTVDASAGGYNDSVNNPWVYVKFTADGLEKVEIDDETALDSMDWDMSLKRFMIRLNGGTSGGSCVGSVSLLEGDYDSLTEIPAGLSYVVDEFYSSDCVIINDSSGLPGSPQLALAPWWSYSECVKTTGVPHLIQLADGSVIKMVVDAYYTSGQEDCNAGTGSGTGSADYTLRWAYME
jgi:hypothetical protein